MFKNRKDAGEKLAKALEKYKAEKRFRCKKSGYFTKSVKNITNGIFICSKQINNDTKKQ